MEGWPRLLTKIQTETLPTYVINLCAAPVWGTGGREFKSRRSDHLIDCRHMCFDSPHLSLQLC